MNDVKTAMICKTIEKIGVAVAISVAAIKLKRPLLTLLIPVSSSTIKISKKPVDNVTEQEIV